MTSDQQALQFLRAGRLPEAERLYLEILRAEPAHAGARHFLGIIRFQQGRHDEALEQMAASLQLSRDADVLTSQGNVLLALGRFDEALESYDQALGLKPGLVNTLLNRGTTLSHMKRFAEALASYDQALSLHPDDAEIWLGRSTIFLETDRPTEALADAEKALALAPDFPDAWNNRGIALQALDRAEEARASYDKALAIKPDYAEASHGRGLALTDLRKPEEALASFDRAIASNPLYAEAWNNRGSVLLNLDRPAEALASFEKALAINPDYVEGLFNRGNLLSDLKRSQDALASFDKALALAPDHARAWNNRGTTLWQMHRSEEALASYDKALAARPDYAEVLHKRGNLLWAEKHDLDGAIADLEKALLAGPDSDYLRGDLLHLKMQQGDWRGYEAQKAAIDDGVRAGKRVVQPLYYLTMTDSPAALQACARTYSADLYPPAPALWKGGTRRSGKIRLGYLTGEFREHPVGYLSAGLFEHHDKDRFEIIALDNGRGDASPTRKRMESAFGKFIDITKMPDRAAAEKILAEGIDILVDMNGYTRNHRIGVFARRPAPIQVSYLGFPGTLGAPYMDYVIADPVLIPESERQFYDERVVTLPDTYQANDSRRPVPRVMPRRTEWGLPENGFVFCNFNNIHKLTPESFAAWMRILTQVPGSVLWLLESNKQCSENLRREAEAQGVAGERLIFAPVASQEAHMARLKMADLCLDTLPYNAHTTASDALWIGVPLITCRGHSFAARVAASLLTAIQVPELVTDSWQAYEALALDLARDPVRLRAIRTKVNSQRPVTPLFDTSLYCRHLEAAYTGMWDRLQRGEPPQSFAVGAKELA